MTDSSASNSNQSRQGKFTTRDIVLIGVMGAIVFVSNYISFPIPLAIGGDATRVHIANGFCLLAGMVLGPVAGGLSAGIGSALYDLTFPAFVSSMPFTFLFKFLMAFTAGKIANNTYGHTAAPARNLVGGICGQLVYIVLYIGRKFIKTYFLLHSALGTALTDCGISLLTSLVNAVFAVIIVILLVPVFRRATHQIQA